MIAFWLLAALDLRQVDAVDECIMWVEEGWIQPDSFGLCVGTELDDQEET